MTELRIVDPRVVESLGDKFVEPTTSLPEKYRILFSLRNIAGEKAHDAMLLGNEFRARMDAGLKDPSALLRHEVAYCLGQRQDPAAIETLKAILSDENEHPMVRHEAGEALGAIGTEACIEPLVQRVDDACLEVAQTCQLALQRIEYHQSAENKVEGEEEPARYLNVDPTPPAPASTPTEQLRNCFLDENARIFDRYRAMFALRNRGGADALETLTQAFKTSKSALLKHELAYVLGQMQDEGAIVRLKEVLENPIENPMVRHEAAEALGSIAAPDCLQLLHQFSEDPEPIVAHSCVVALDMLHHEQTGEFEYAAS